MALTSDEETKVRTIITAFDGGKKISELPATIVGTPYTVVVEVLDSDGASKQSPLASLLPSIENDQLSYGVRINTAVTASALTRIGSVNLHQTLPIQSGMRGCLVTDAGVVTYLPSGTWAGSTLDGTAGQVMVELPAHYRKITVISGTETDVRISSYPIPGYHLVKKMYISAYEASIKRSTGALCSLVNAATDYRGGDNTSAWDATYRTLLGRPVTNLTRTQFRTAARLRNSDTLWNCQDYSAYKSMYWLYIIEYANTNSQLAVNAALDANGYKQGGLGTGVTDWDSGSPSWGDWNTNNPFVPCGHTNSLGNLSGELVFNIPASGGGTLRTTYANRYRGVENPFGHIWKWTDGINIEVAAVNSTVYVSNTPSNYNDDNYTGYTNRGLQARSAGYISKMILGEFGELIASEVSGGSTTGWCDYFYTNTTQALRGLLSGGLAYSGAAAGFGSSYADNAPSTAHTTLGSRLCFIPA